MPIDNLLHVSVYQAAFCLDKVHVVIGQQGRVHFRMQGLNCLFGKELLRHFEEFLVVISELHVKLAEQVFSCGPKQMSVIVESQIVAFDWVFINMQKWTFCSFIDWSFKSLAS